MTNTKKVEVETEIDLGEEEECFEEELALEAGNDKELEIERFQESIQELKTIISGKEIYIEQLERKLWERKEEVKKFNLNDLKAISYISTNYLSSQKIIDEYTEVLNQDCSDSEDTEHAESQLFFHDGYKKALRDLSAILKLNLKF